MYYLYAYKCNSWLVYIWRMSGKVFNVCVSFFHRDVNTIVNTVLFHLPTKKDISVEVVLFKVAVTN